MSYTLFYKDKNIGIHYPIFMFNNCTPTNVYREREKGGYSYD